MGLKRILLDTNAYVAVKRNNKSIVEIIRCVEIIGFCPVVLGELLGGFAHGSKETQNRKELNDFMSSSRVQVFPATETTASYYAQVYSRLRKKGKPIPTNDMWIAACALEYGLAVCTLDIHFKEVGGLMVANSPEHLLP